MKKEAHHHHYIPQCYLRGFTKSGGIKSKLIVFDLKEKNIFHTMPRNVAGIKDFNRIDIDNFKPDAIESSLSSFETELAKSLKHIEKTKIFNVESRDYILNLIALLTVRSPQMRKHWRKIYDDIANKMLDLSLVSKEGWDSITKKMEKDGYNVHDDMTYEDMKKFHEKKNIKSH